MSDMRRGLNDWASAHGTQVAQHMRQGDSESRVRGQAARRRRTRALGGAAGATVAVVGIAWAATALPFTERPVLNPAADVTLGAEQVPAALRCGESWTLERGETRHDGSQGAGTVRGAWQVTTDSGETSSDPQQLWVGYEALVWYQRSEGLSLETGTMMAVVAAVKDGTIVGVTPPAGSSLDLGLSEFGAWAPLPGECGDTTQSAADGTYEYHVVQQLQDPFGQPIVTWVDPEGAVTLDLSGLADWYASKPHSTPTQTPEPGGDTYTAYVVDRPAPRTACHPLQDLRNAGEPTAERLTYQVTIPGVQPIIAGAREWGPLAKGDASVADAWYFSEPAWLVFDNPGSSPESTAEWNPEQFTLDLPTDGPSAPGSTMNCPTFFFYAPPSGSIWLVIDGVDAQTLGETYPTMDLALEDKMTWVYLGEVQGEWP